LSSNKNEQKFFGSFFQKRTRKSASFLKKEAKTFVHGLGVVAASP
jgi:hypothetical protein